MLLHPLMSKIHLKTTHLHILKIQNSKMREFLYVSYRKIMIEKMCYNKCVCDEMWWNVTKKCYEMLCLAKLCYQKCACGEIWRNVTKKHYEILRNIMFDKCDIQMCVCDEMWRNVTKKCYKILRFGVNVCNQL